MASSSDQEDSGSGRRGRPLVFDELRWVVQIRESLTEDGKDEDDDGIPVSVFNVPKQLLVHKPEAYVPQFIALGPYHHWRPELYEMERYKLAAARRAQRRLRPAGLKLEALVAEFAERLERKIRAYYHRYLDFSGLTLTWMMVVDGSFLLEFLQIYAAAEDGGKPALRRVSSRMAHLVDFAGRKSAHGLILRDMLMLENQIPLFLLRKILEPQCASADEAGVLLTSMVTGLVKELFPFKMMDGAFPAVDVSKYAHLLELLYYLLVPKPPSEDTTAEAHDHDENYDIDFSRNSLRQSKSSPPAPQTELAAAAKWWRGDAAIPGADAAVAVAAADSGFHAPPRARNYPGGRAPPRHGRVRPRGQAERDPQDQQQPGDHRQAHQRRQGGVRRGGGGGRRRQRRRVRRGRLRPRNWLSRPAPPGSSPETLPFLRTNLYACWSPRSPIISSY